VSNLFSSLELGESEPLTGDVAWGLKDAKALDSSLRYEYFVASYVLALAALFLLALSAFSNAVIHLSNKHIVKQ
jgi:hypothetical protein